MVNKPKFNPESEEGWEVAGGMSITKIVEGRWERV
jgi:hypothetical protein